MLLVSLIFPFLDVLSCVSNTPTSVAAITVHVGSKDTAQSARDSRFMTQSVISNFFRDIEELATCFGSIMIVLMHDDLIRSEGYRIQVMNYRLPRGCLTSPYFLIRDSLESGSYSSLFVIPNIWVFPS